MRILFALFSFLFVATGFGFDGIPESYLHPELPFTGTPLPASYGLENGKADVALYVGKGVWETGREHLKLFLVEHGYSYETLLAQDVLSGHLNKGYKTLIMPGGASWEYIAELGDAGASQIKEFVKGGGGYVGICAGAFYATSHREGGKATGPYGIGLLEGTAYDGTALETDPFVEGMMDFSMASHFLTGGLNAVYRMVLLGGPSFRYSPQEAQQKTLLPMAYFQKINEPAMVTFQYGNGRVFLSGPHLEVEEDRTEWGKEYQDPESDWPILQKAIEYLSGL